MMEMKKMYRYICRKHPKDCVAKCRLRLYGCREDLRRTSRKHMKIYTKVLSSTRSYRFERVLLPIFILSLFCILVSCNTKKPPRYTIGFSQCTNYDDWRKTMLAEMKRELSFHDDVAFIFKDADGSSERQIDQVKELMQQGIDLLIVSPNEVKPLSPIIQKVFNSGIPVIQIDRRIDSTDYTAFVGASNFEVGQNAGRYAISLLKGKGSILEIAGLKDASPFIDRHKGFMDIISGKKEIRYLGKIEDHSKTYKNELEAALGINDIDLIFAQNDYLAYDAYQMCKKLGLDKRVKIIGIDGLPSKGGGMDMVANKEIAATVLYPTGGKEAILTAIGILDHKPYKRENQLFTTVIDSTNVGIMKLQNDKMAEQQVDIDRRQHRIEQQDTITRHQSTVIYTISISLALSLVLGSVLFYYLRENRKINAKLAQKNNEITAQHLEISAQRNQLIELGKRAEEATEAKINFFTNMSHEFRTPLTLILGPLEELVANPKMSNTDKRYHGLIQKNVLRLLRLVNQLMDFRKTETGKMNLSATENNLVSFTGDIVEAFKETAKKRDIDLRMISSEREILVWFDTFMLDKVLFNLLSNAFKFTNNGGHIHVHLKKIVQENKAVIMVEDSGVGMSETVAQHVFELFYQGMITSQQGSGLGLALSKELVHLHKGDISVTSQKGEGTCFTITLLLGTAHFKKEEMTVQTPHIEKYADQKIYTNEPERTVDNTINEPMPDGIPGGRSVLIIEDNRDLKDFLAGVLGNEYEILAAEEGHSGIKLAYEHIPDIIISDVVLPGKDGFSITSTLKNDIKTSHIPIILLTSKTEIVHQIKGMKNLADAYITKPFNVQFLKETIKSVIKNRQMLRDHYTVDVIGGALSQAPHTLDRKFISEFTAIVENNFPDDKFTIDDICKQMGVSRIQLHRKVNALLDCNISDYILNVRLQKSRFLLSQEDLTIAEIAYRVGFSTPAYFSTVFKTKVGVTPSEFRNKK